MSQITKGANLTGMEWISRTRRLMSTNLRLLVDDFRSPEARVFFQLMKEWEPGSSSDKIVDYYIEHFADLEKADLMELKIGSILAPVIEDFAKRDSEICAGCDALNRAMRFLESAINVYEQTSAGCSAVTRLIFAIFEMKDDDCLNRAANFIDNSLNIEEISILFFSAENLVRLWNSCFLNSSVTLRYGRKFIDLIPSVSIKSLHRLEKSILESQFSRETALNAFDFIFIPVSFSNNC
jgi:hypothetical protein